MNMGTRGFIGFVVDGDEKIIYNHFDSYPDGLGVHVLTWLRSHQRRHPGLYGLRQLVSDLRMVTEEDPVTDEDIEKLKRFHDAVVSTGDEREWYSLLRKTQGDPQAILEAGVAEDAHTFPLDSLFCEWGYLVDFDRDRFEVYKGFQKEPHVNGRFARRSYREHVDGRAYYPVRLMTDWSLVELPDIDEFLDRLSKEEP